MPPRRIRKAPSIRAYLAALAVVAALPLAVLQVRTSREYYRLSLAHGALSAQGLAESTGAATLQLLSLTEGVLRGAAAEIQTPVIDIVPCETDLRRLNRSIPFLINLIVTDRDGAIVCSALPRPVGSPPSVADRDWFVGTQGRGGFAVGAPLLGAITGEWVVAVAVPLTGSDGEYAGALAASVPLGRFQEFLTGAQPGPDELITIADRNRVVLARSLDPEQWVGQTLPPETPQHANELALGSETFGVDFSGIERTWAEVTLPTVGWTVYAGIPTEAIRAPARLAAIRQAGISALIVLLAGLLAWGVQMRISGSLRALVKSARAAADGTPMAAPKRAPREILALAAQFEESLQARGRAEESERKAKERYRSILDNAVFGIYVSTADGRFLDVNPAMAAMLGYEDPEELRAVGPVALYQNPEKRSRFVDRYLSHRVIEGVEVVWVKKDGTAITVRLNGKLVDLDHGDVGFEVMVEDITGQKVLEEELRHTQKMEAVGRLAGGVAHDFNNLLTVIGGNSHVLLADMAPDDPLRGEVEDIYDASQRAEALTRQLLSFSRKEPLQPRPVDVNELVGNLEKMLGRLMREDIRIHTVLDPEVKPLLADPSQLEQVIMNLAVNARHAMPDGGDLTLTTNWSRHGPPLERATPARGGWIRLVVQDTGQGMDDAVKERIFEPFFTTKSAGEGTGLGLATVYAIVDGAGGHILVESTPGVGSRFDIWLPVLQGDAAGPAPATESATPGRPGGGTVLVAEDELPVRRIVQRVLEGAGYQVLLAADGREAIEMIDSHTGPIHLVISDVVMPEAKGTEVAEHVARVRPETPVLLMSGYVDNLPVQQATASNPNLFLPKPFTPSQLRARVHQIIGKAAGQAGTSAPKASA